MKKLMVCLGLMLIFSAGCSRPNADIWQHSFGPFTKDTFSVLFSDATKDTSKIMYKSRCWIGKDYTGLHGVLVLTESCLNFVAWSDSEFKYYSVMKVNKNDVSSVYKWENELFGLNSYVLTVKRKDESEENFSFSLYWMKNIDAFVELLS